MNPTPFATAIEFRQWLERHHASTADLTVLFYNQGSGKPSLTYSEAVDEALCFGWIDGVVHKVGTDCHTRRFTPRRPSSSWSLANIRRVERLTEAGRMHAAGMKAFAARSAARTGVYSFEQRPNAFPLTLETMFRANRTAWTFWQAQPPGYRRMTMWWVISAKQSATRQRRLAQLITDSATGRRIGMK